jgi:hypothetical protein
MQKMGLFLILSREKWDLGARGYWGKGEKGITRRKEKGIEQWVVRGKFGKQLCRRVDLRRGNMFFGP